MHWVRRHLIGLIAGVASCAAVAAIVIVATLPPGRPTPAPIVARPDCIAAVLRDGGGPFGSTPSPTPAFSAVEGSIPKGFVPVAALECSQAFGPVAGQPVLPSDAGRIAEIRFEGHLGKLLAAIDKPDDRRPPVCDDVGHIESPLWLMDASGRAILVHQPQLGCGGPRPEYTRALKALKPVSTDYVTIYHTS